MDKGLQKCLDKLTEALQYSSESNVARIRACYDYFRAGSDPREYMKEVAEIEYKTGHKIYADIGGDSNLAAIYDIASVLVGKKKQSSVIQRIVYIDPDEDAAPTENN